MMDAGIKAWGRFASLAFALIVLLVGQGVSIAAVSWFYGLPLRELPGIGGDGVAVAIIILVSTTVEVGLLTMLARRAGNDPLRYLALTVPSRGQLLFGIAGVVALIVVLNTVSWLFGRDIVTTFQSDIVRTASATGWLALLWFAVVVGAPVGEEVLFRGFVFRGWLRTPNDAWPAIVITAALFAMLHIQYDWFVIGQIFCFGLFLGWMRWATGSTLLTIILHALINFEGMLETTLLSQ
jgi:membrane protease YdiL (CAAX protease family)